MKTKLIMLQTPIIVSNEGIKKGDKFIQIDRLDIGILIADVNFGYDPNDPAKKIIAGIPELPQIDWNGLEEEFGYIDVEKLFQINLKDWFYKNNNNHKTYMEGSSKTKDFFDLWFKGFKACQQLNDGKLKESWDDAWERMQSVDIFCSANVINFLSRMYDKPTLKDRYKVFDIEVEWDTLWLNKRPDFGGIWQPFPDESATEKKHQPKITNNKIKILKWLK